MRLSRYLAGDVLGHTFAVSLVLLAIIITGRFVKYLADAASGELAAEILLPVMLYRLPGFLELLLPLGLFIGILMAYGRLYVESEMVILSACGIGPGRLARITLVPATLIMLLVGSLALLLTPQGAARSEALLNDPRAFQGINLLQEGRFQSRGGSGVVSYAAAIDRDEGELQRVFFYEPAEEGDDGAPSVTVAQRGRVVRDEETRVRYIEFEEGFRFNGAAGAGAFQITTFDTFGQRLPEDPSLSRAQPVDARPTMSLIGSIALEDIAAFHWRLSLVAMVPIVALLALALSKTNHRQGRYIKLAPALILHLSYLMLLASIRTRVAEGDGTIELFWLCHGVFLVLALLLLQGPTLRQRLRFSR